MTRVACIAGEDGARGSLSAARSLHAAGWEVVAAVPRRDGVVSSSRAVSRTVLVEGDRVTDLADLGRQVAADVWFAGGDEWVLGLAAAADSLPGIVAYPRAEITARTFDKLELYRCAVEVGLDPPRTELATPEAVRGWTGPAMVKPRSHAADGRVNAVLTADVPAAVDAMTEAGATPLLQEVVSGSLVALTVLPDRRGGFVGAVQQRADLTWPQPAGVSVRASTEEVDATLLEPTLELLRRMEWPGLAQVQFLAAGGRLRCIDLNGRFYGSLALAVAAGCDFPRWWADALVGESTPTGVLGKPGVRYQWLEADLRAAAASSRRLPALRGTFKAARGSVHVLLDASDPRPAVRQVRNLAGRAMRKARR